MELILVSDGKGMEGARDMARAMSGKVRAKCWTNSIIPIIPCVGLQPAEGSSIPGIRRWLTAYLPGIFQPELVDRTLNIGQDEAEQTMRRLAREEGIFAASVPAARWRARCG